MVRARTLPPVEELQAALAEAGVTDAPAEGPDAHRLQGLLDLALYVAEHKKRVTFSPFAWEDPSFLSHDAKAELRFMYAELEGTLAATLDANLARLRGPRALLALDVRRAGAREFDLQHALYGEPTLFQWPSKPVQSADPRIEAAREAGWTPTLKTHNLLPGRGIVVLDEHQGLLLREGYEALAGVLVLLPNGQTELWWNPFAREADAELQHWKAWGEGTGPASGWREAFYAEES